MRALCSLQQILFGIEQRGESQLLGPAAGCAVVANRRFEAGDEICPFWGNVYLKKKHKGKWHPTRSIALLDVKPSDADTLLISPPAACLGGNMNSRAPWNSGAVQTNADFVEEGVAKHVASGQNVSGKETQALIKNRVLSGEWVRIKATQTIEVGSEILVDYSDAYDWFTVWKEMQGPRGTA